MHPTSGILTSVLEGLSALHLQHVVNRVGPISEAEVQGKMSEAALIHAREWSRSPHPVDPELPAAAHDWATYHIAVNLVARERGCDVGSQWQGWRVTRLPVQQHMALTPAMRTGEE